MPPSKFPHKDHWTPEYWARGPGALRHGSRKAWRGRPGFIFFRFLFAFGFIAMLFFGGVIVVAYLLGRLASGDIQITPNPVWLGWCAVPMLLMLIGGWVVRRAFRSIATPLGEMMDAADRVAEGDFSVRVSEWGRGEFSQLARAFNRMTEELERADRRRRNLTADVAHELRNPLHILQGNLEGVLDGVYEPDEAQISAMLDETHTLSRLVEDLGTLSLAEAGQLPLVKVRVNLAEFLADIQTTFSGPAEEAGLDLVVEMKGDLTVHADPDRLDQVISNLIVNGLRHTPAGGRITLAAQPHIPAEPGTRPDRAVLSGVEGVRLTVSDTGEGITEEDLPFIFDRFWKGDWSRRRREGSRSGLGLAVAHQLVSAHGGTISVESAVGEGTTFTIVLPTVNVND